MNSTWFPTTAHIPSGFALPISGATFGGGIGSGMATDAKVCSAPTYVVRDRHVAGATLTQGAVPGPTAWSPPIC